MPCQLLSRGSSQLLQETHTFQGCHIFVKVNLAVFYKQHTKIRVEREMRWVAPDMGPRPRQLCRAVHRACIPLESHGSHLQMKEKYCYSFDLQILFFQWLLSCWDINAY